MSFRRSRILPVICTALLLPVTAASGQNTIFPSPLSPRIANYDIDARYDPARFTLEGREKLRWRNEGTDTVRSIEMHLYLNAFRNNRSTFMMESEDLPDQSPADSARWGFCQIRSLLTENGEELTGRIRYIHPDDDNTDDRTVIEIPLPSPVLPGDTLVLSSVFTSKFPRPPVARSGGKAEYLFAGQWFPKIGVFENGSWNCHQYHAQSEFFADFGVYNVNITLPQNEIVGATGLETGSEQNSDGTTTHRFHAEDVHDFAWTASPEYVEFRGRAEQVDIRVLMQPDHREQGPRYLAAAATALKYFHDWYGDYPFPNLTVVDPRRGARESAGMEYPTLFTAWTTHGIPAGCRIPEMIIIHEFGHNYWYHLLASNEFEESWMDEGINTFTETQIMREAYGQTGNLLDLLGFTVDDLTLNRVEYLGAASCDPTLRFAWKYYSGASYGVNSYAKPAVLLTTLQNYLGTETMRRIMRAYVNRWKFRHPTTKDFIAVANEVSGRNLNWFFDQAIYSNAVLDYSVDKVTTREISPGRGFGFTDRLTGNGPAADSAPSVPDTGRLYASEVDVRRLGTFIFPVTVEAKFEDGSRVREQWDGKDTWTRFRYTRRARLVSATVDPDRLIPLDINLTNNSRTVDYQTLGVTTATLRVLFWFQSLFDQPEIFNMLNVVAGLF